MNNTIPHYNDPAQCIHFAENGRCNADWYHEECALCSTWIRCPKYEAKNGITYDILNDAEIAASYGGEYLLTHVIASLKSAFARSKNFIFQYYIDDEKAR